jgi:hypothetical protein
MRHGDAAVRGGWAVDVNPLLVLPEGAYAADAVVELD